MIIRKSAQEIEKMAAAGRVVAETIAHVGEQLEPGITTGELDRIAEEKIRSLGGIPTSQGYRGYPAAICISPNDMVVHGIPGAHTVSEGDLITIDVGVTRDGYIADSAYTFPVGEITDEAQRLLDTGREAPAGRHRPGGARQPGRRHLPRRPAARRGGRLLGRAQPRRTRRRPLVPRGSRTSRISASPAAAQQLSEGMTLAIEPMITAGAPDVYVHEDEWSISTDDGSLAAHFEHTVAITAEGPRILTATAVPLLS